MKVRRYALVACVLCAAVSTTAVGLSEARGAPDHFVSECGGRVLQVPARPIIAFGDSITWGVNGKTCRSHSRFQILPVAGHSPITDERNYPADLSRLMGHTVLNYGVPGETTTTGLHRLRSVLALVHPRTVLILEGVNDLLTGFSIASVIRNLQRMAGATRRAGARPILLTSLPTFFPRSAPLSPTNARVRPLEAAERVLALRDGVQLVDTASVVHPWLVGSDHEHPNAAGYQRIAQAVAAKIDR